MGKFSVNELVDSFGRVHKDLRISLTDRCNLRCSYCMPEEFNLWIPSNEHLTTDEMITAIDIAVQAGITEIRLTGGEPLLRPDIVEMVRRINELPNPPAISMTTNGIALIKVSQALVDAGLQRINVSLDTLIPERFKAITKRDRIKDVFAGLKAARAAGLSPIKINSVLLRGINDDEAPALVEWALSENYQLRFIEQMPLDAGNAWSRDTFITAAEIFESLSKFYELTPVPNRGSSPAEEYLVNGGPASIGIIASISKPFCAACDRLRLTSDGQLRSCLFSKNESNVRDVLRDPLLTDVQKREKVSQIINLTVASKEVGHYINTPTFIKPTRPMSAIGG
jgi:cyclic pyranopterin phosphate synthase